MRTMDRLEVVLIVALIVMWLSMVLMGCTTTPAKQQSNQHITEHSNSVSIADLDTNQDGMLDAREQAQMHTTTPDHQDILITFVSIMGLVIVISVACGMMSRKSKRSDTPQTPTVETVSAAQSDPALEPAAPDQLLSERQSERLRRPRPEDEQFQI